MILLNLNFFACDEYVFIVVIVALLYYGLCEFMCISLLTNEIKLVNPQSNDLSF